jgi:hypothetical protein
MLGATDDPRKEHTLSILLAPTRQRMGRFISPALAINLVRIEETPLTPILYVWVTDVTLYPYAIA